MTKTNATPASGPLDSDEELLAAYRMMVLIRTFEDETQRQFLAGTIGGTTHLYNGQEAVAAGLGAALQPGDELAATYRSHGHVLARGVSPAALMAELMGRTTGVNRGRAGGMNIISREHGLVGCYGIIGGSIAAATGAALGVKGRGGVAAAAFGDGTCNQAYLGECLNLAKVLSLPLLFVCENNLYGEYTPITRSTAGDLCDRAAAYGMPAVKVDGNDVVAVANAVAAAAAPARAGDGPTFLECLTYRHLGHSKSDPGTYRPKEEVERWKAKDPIPAARRVLLEERGLSADTVDAIDHEVGQLVADAVDAALAADLPDPSTQLTEYAHAA